MCLCNQYLEWIERLGWVTRPMLTTLTRPEVGTGKDKNLDKYLCRWLREGKVRRVRFGRRSFYYLPRYRTGRHPNIWHGVLSAQAVVYLWKQFPNRERLILSPADFVKANLPVIPDFALAVKFSDGLHLFLLEFQMPEEAGRTTGKKVTSYADLFDQIRTHFQAAAVWVIVVIRRERLWVAQYAQSVTQPFVYLIDAKTYFGQPNVVFSPVFFAASGGQTTLVDGTP